MSDKCIWELEDEHFTTILLNTGCDADIIVYPDQLGNFKYCPYCGNEIEIK